MRNVGRKIGKWTIIALQENKTKDGHKLYTAKCELCGYIKKNCKPSNLAKSAFTTKCFHCEPKARWENERLRRIFLHMKQRCDNPKDKDYRFYGAKGIRVCQEWKEKPGLFQEWSLNNGYADDLTIDRIDSELDYCPENCQWITAKENSRKIKTRRLITVDGVKDSLSGWAIKTQTPKNTFVTNARKMTDEEVVVYIKEKLDKIKENKEF